MTSSGDVTDGHGVRSGSRPPHHQRSKTSVFRSFLNHKRTNSDGSALPASEDLARHAQDPFLTPGTPGRGRASADDRRLPDMGAFPRPPQALGELQQNGQDPASRSQSQSPKKIQGDEPPRSPTKGTFSALSLKGKLSRSRETSPEKPKKNKSSTSLVGLLRPRSAKNLKQLADDAEEDQKSKDKENRTPPASMASTSMAPPPIFAQFTSQPGTPRFNLNASSSQLHLADPYATASHHKPDSTLAAESTSTPKQRPKSYQAYGAKQEKDASMNQEAQTGKDGNPPTERSQKRLTWGRGSGAVKPSSSRPTLFGAFTGANSKQTSPERPSAELKIEPQDIDKYLEAMLDRRNIPENQRYKMRNLNDTIKMEFIRQDWAETQAKEMPRPVTKDGEGSLGSKSSHSTAGGAENGESKKKKKDRPLSFTLARKSSKEKGLGSPTKKSRGEFTLGRHFRTKSTESVTSERPTSSEGPITSTYSSGFLAKVKGQQGPGDFVSYLRKVQKPESVEVGKLHKLRLLLRNETVAWTEDFIRQGGMKEVVGLLHRIMEVEWREEHEDALLHENLLCLKALCTTDLALQYVHSIHTTLFPALLHMLFDPEKKGPSEFTTRNIITFMLLTYIESAAPAERVIRAQTVLGYLRDPEGKEDERPVEFVLEMRRERPYRVWNKELVNVTKEVFWIFLHHLNVVALPSDRKAAAVDTKGNPVISSAETEVARPMSTHPMPASDPDGRFAYMAQHFPPPRPPVPAAPYVGGVEWDATNYMASHVELVNAIIACTGPTAVERNALRAQLRISGWERCLGGTLRLCKEKFYGAVHDALRTWVAAAAEDGWDVRDVRYGPPATESRSKSPAKRSAAANGKKKDGVLAEPPRIEMPKLDFALSSTDHRADLRANDPWLS